jgi:ferredoxin
MPSRRQLIFGAFLRTEQKSSPDAAAKPLPDAGPRIVAFAEHCLAQQNVVCRSCAEICEHDAIRFSPRLGGAALPVLNSERCTGCGDCLSICPNAALSLVSAGPAPSLTRNSEEFVA